MTYREEVIGDARLILGDASDVLPTLERVDAVVTDPPYGVHSKVQHGDARAFQKAGYQATGWNDDEDYIGNVCVPIVVSSLNIADRGCVTPGIRCLHLYPRARDIGCFWTPAAATHGPWGFTTFQPILYYGRDFRAGKGALPSGRALTEASEKNGHPCPKPLSGWMWLLDKISQPKETVLDPFMGSGTTGVACARLGRRFIGIEIEPKYFDIACRRIEAAYKQADLFVAAPAPKATQPALFGDAA